MTITATEFKTNFGKYLEMVFKEDIFITKNGKIVAKVTQPQNEKIAALTSLIGFAKTDKEVNPDEFKSERLSKQWEF